MLDPSTEVSPGWPTVARPGKPVSYRSIVRSVWVIMAAAVVVLSSCAGSAEMTSLTANDDGRTVNLTTGDQFQVALGGNPTTGYAWTVNISDEGIVAALDEPRYEPDPESAGQVGAGGVYTWRFTAIREGSTRVNFAYARSFEDRPPLETCTITIRVPQ